MESAESGSGATTPSTPPATGPATPAATPDTPATPVTPLAERRVLTRDEILNVDDLTYELVPVDEWKRGAVVRVSSLRSGARAALEDFIIARNTDTSASKNADVREMFVALCVVDEQGRALFSVDDVAALRNKSARPIDRIFEVAKRLNDVSEKAVAREAGNSDGEGSATSPLPLP